MTPTHPLLRPLHPPWPGWPRPLPESEWLVSGGGVGQYMIESQHSLDYGALWSAAVGLTVASALLYAMVGAAARLVLGRLSDVSR